jgi:hypothetical protein
MPLSLPQKGIRGACAEKINISDTAMTNFVPIRVPLEKVRLRIHGKKIRPGIHHRKRHPYALPPYFSVPPYFSFPQ